MLLALFLVMIAVLCDPDLLLLPRAISSFSSCRCYYLHHYHQYHYQH